MSWDAYHFVTIYYFSEDQGKFGQIYGGTAKEVNKTLTQNLELRHLCQKKWGIDGSTPFKTGQLSHLCP